MSAYPTQPSPHRACCWAKLARAKYFRLDHGITRNLFDAMRHQPAAVLNVDPAGNGIGPHLSRGQGPDLVGGLMKGEGMAPGLVVYTAALAECLWAGQKQHAEYLLSQLKADGLVIAPGIPEAASKEPPPSQIPAIYKSTSSAGPEIEWTAPPTAATTAGRAAEAALATVEGMWAAAAGGARKFEPTPATSRAALGACAAGGQWERALSLVRDAALVDDDAGVEDGGFAERVERLAVEGRWLEALALVQGAASSSEA